MTSQPKPKTKTKTRTIVISDDEDADEPLPDSEVGISEQKMGKADLPGSAQSVETSKIEDTS
jgi:hypothetical protein